MFSACVNKTWLRVKGLFKRRQLDRDFEDDSMDDLTVVSLAQQRFNMSLLGIFAALALILAAVGIYGLMSYAVSQRTHEIGVRMAVGAQGGDVSGLVVGDGAKLTFLGIVIGIAAGVGLTRLMASLLFEVTPTDPETFAICGDPAGARRALCVLRARATSHACRSHGGAAV